MTPELAASSSIADGYRRPSPSGRVSIITHFEESGRLNFDNDVLSFAPKTRIPSIENTWTRFLLDQASSRTVIETSEFISGVSELRRNFCRQKYFRSASSPPRKTFPRRSFSGERKVAFPGISVSGIAFSERVINVRYVHKIIAQINMA